MHSFVYQNNAFFSLDTEDKLYCSTVLLLRNLRMGGGGGGGGGA